MKTLSKEEMLRLDALQLYEVPGVVPVGAPWEPALAEITALAAQLCSTPLAGLSFVGADGLYYHARIGPGVNKRARGLTPDESCIQSGESVCEINDARYHPDYRPDGIMIAGRAYRFWAGAPLTTQTGVTIGTLFVQDSVPHSLTDKQKQALLTLARQVVTRLELSARMRHMDREGRVRQRVETALTVERNFVSTVLDTVGALVAVFDTAGRIVRFNRTCEEVSGYDSAELVGRYVWERLIPQADVAAEIASFERLRAGQFPSSFENHWRSKTGTLKRIAWSATALLDPQGQTTFIIATGIDVTLQREQEATVRESEARYRQLVEGSLGVVYTHDAAGVLLSVNKHGAEVLGRDAATMIGQKLSSFIPAGQQVAFEHYLAELAATGEAQGRLSILDGEGALRIIAFRNKLIQVFEHGPNRQSYVLGFGVDISEQVRAEEKLRTLTNQSNSIFESVGEGIYAIDLKGRVTVVNPAALQMLGYRADELLGKELHPLVHHSRADGSPYPAQECAISGTLQDFSTVRISNEVFWRKDGTSFPVEYVARPQIDTQPDTQPGTQSQDGISGKAVGVVVAFTDTTERRALERMKDEFISTVSHELRTPLTSLRAALGLVTGGALATRPDRMQHMLEIAIGNTDRLIKLVNDILDIERITSGNAELHSVLCSAGALMERSVGLQHAAALRRGLRFTIDAGDVQVWGDPDRLLQALSNLISNAIKFSPRDGEITLHARNLNEQEAELTVHDRGRGVPADKLESIFERFQQVDASDSRTMGGTGLGLAIFRSIVAQHGGRLWATSPEGEGATFHFTLPNHPKTI